MKIAVLTTAFTRNSHADVIVRRWVDPLPTDKDYEWEGATTQLGSLHVAQTGQADVSADVCRAGNIRACGSIAEALTLGSSRLAVDAVMIIAEHGDYPENEFQQKLYPRKEFLDQVLAVFDRCHRTVPVFIDKHLSWNADWAREMYWGLCDRGVPWFGGSSLSHCPAVPSVGDLQQADFQEIVVTTWGGVESYLFHALEVLEAVVEQRAGGETGIASIIAWRNEEGWAALDNGEFSLELLKAAIGATGPKGTEVFEAWNQARALPLEIFQLRYCDGLKATIVSMHQTVRKWAFGCRIAGRGKPVASAMQAGTAELGYPHFARMARRIEDFFLSGVSPVPQSRLYLTTLACAYCMRALAAPGKPLPGSSIPVPIQRRTS